MLTNKLFPSPFHRNQLRKTDLSIFRFFWPGSLLILLILGSACQPGVRSTPIIPSQLPLPTTENTETPAPTATLTPSKTPPPATSTPTTVPAASICAPLVGFTLETLPDIMSNPFKPPRPGNDDGHHGVDFSFWSYKGLTAMKGLGILSVLNGQVAMVDTGHFPFGNVVMVETLLDDLPESWVQALHLPPVEPFWVKDNRLYCPEALQQPKWDTSQRSLYLLYAHMLKPSALQVGAKLHCGDPIGQVGSTGDSSNDHLHLEVRVGPSGATFAEMNHYKNDATDLQMSNYCTWRVSGIFKMIDPMLLLSIKP